MRTWKVNRTKENDGLFDLYIRMELFFNDAKICKGKLDKALHEFEYFKKKFWDMVYEELKVKDIPLSLDNSSNIDLLIISEKDNSFTFPNILRNLF